MTLKRRPPDPTFERLLLLDRLEELREEMDELDVTSIADLEAKIAALEAEIEDEDDDGPV